MDTVPEVWEGSSEGTSTPPSPQSRHSSTGTSILAETSSETTRCTSSSETSIRPPHYLKRSSPLNPMSLSCYRPEMSARSSSTASMLLTANKTLVPFPADPSVLVAEAENMTGEEREISCRGVGNIVTLVALIMGILALFIIYPMFSYYRYVEAV
ncbi:hypothetical protein APHAL10511_008698 [Amanita phalloides]|nr:hypothetical protein APHAL10511_008698 [Amanita phalloides]